MCGIYGYIGGSDATQKCLHGLKQLEYRGYDSAGIAGVYNGKITSRKKAGKVSVLEEVLKKKPLHLETAIAHTRWATHGETTSLNAHPHCDHNKHIAVVHNGIIENHKKLRHFLEEEGMTFSSQTDSEVIVQLVAYYYEGDPLRALHKALQQMSGIWGIALIHRNHPGKIYAASQENPIAITLDIQTQEAFVSSDLSAFGSGEKEVLFLQSGESAVIEKDRISLYNNDLSQITHSFKTINLSDYKPSKEGFDHYMLKEILEQPVVFERLIENRVSPSLLLPELDAISAQKIDRILLIGCGSSWHAAKLIAPMMESITGIPTTAEIASELRYQKKAITENSLLIPISQSGETIDTLSALRVMKQTCKSIGLCNCPHSTLSREVDIMFPLLAGKEISVCSTKAFSAQIFSLILIALDLAVRRETLTQTEEWAADLSSLPSLIEEVLTQRKKIKQLAEKFAQYEHFFFLGRGTMYPTALEAALKLKEVSYIHALGLPAGEMKHGPIALITPETVTVGLLGSSVEKTISNLVEVASRKGKLLLFAPKSAEEKLPPAEEVIFLPESREELASIPYSIALQLFSYYCAKERGTDIDKPRNLAKSVTVE